MWLCHPLHGFHLWVWVSCSSTHHSPATGKRQGSSGKFSSAHIPLAINRGPRLQGRMGNVVSNWAAMCPATTQQSYYYRRGKSILVDEERSLPLPLIQKSFTKLHHTLPGNFQSVKVMPKHSLHCDRRNFYRRQCMNIMGHGMKGIPWH